MPYSCYFTSGLHFLSLKEKELRVCVLRVEYMSHTVVMRLDSVFYRVGVR
jgi:hypothetical protein